MATSTELIVSLLLTIIGYLIFPVIYFFSLGKVEKQKANKLALYNSIVVACCFALVRGIIGGADTIFSSFAPAVLYYYIVRRILWDKSLDTVPLDENVATQENNNNVLETQSDEEIEISNYNQIFEIEDQDVKIEQEENDSQKTKIINKTKTSKQVTRIGDLKKELQELKDLYDDGLIDEEEYQKMRKKILNIKGTNGNTKNTRTTNRESK